MLYTCRPGLSDTQAMGKTTGGKKRVQGTLSVASTGAPLSCLPSCKCGKRFGAGSVSHMINHFVIHNGAINYDDYKTVEKCVELCQVTPHGTEVDVSNDDWTIELGLAAANGYKGCVVSGIQGGVNVYAAAMYTGVSDHEECPPLQG